MRLFDRLRKRGWIDEQSRLVAPNGTIWLEKAKPWHTSGEEFLAQMQDRLKRIKANEVNLKSKYSKSSDEALCDTRGLIDCLCEMYGAVQTSHQEALSSNAKDRVTS